MEYIKKVKRVLALVLTLMVFLSAIVPAQASEKAVSKKTISISLNKKNPRKWYWVKVASGDSETKISIKVDKLKGKPTEKKIPYLFGMADETGKGPMVYDLKSSKYKKGATLPLEYSTMVGDGFVEFYMPDGVTSVTYKVTFKNSKKKNAILKIVKSDVETLPEGFEWGKHQDE